jgi:hypothetical protein
MDCLPQNGKFNVGIERMHVAAATMAHQLLADVGDDTGLDKA